MTQGRLPFQYESDRSSEGVTGLAGLPVYVELAQAAGLAGSIKRHVGVAGSRGWDDVQQVLALVALNLAGGEGLEDLERLEGDAGLGQLMLALEGHGLTRAERRAAKRRWRGERRRAVPSAAAAGRWLARFHAPGEEERRVAGRAFIPAPGAGLQGLARVNGDVLAFVQANRPVTTATLDMDATLIETHKRQALYCYEHFKAYQPLNTWWAEQGLVVHSEFRDGNVPAGHEQLRVMREAAALLPAGVRKLYLRSDTAGYQQELLKYCAEGRDARFGVIEFAIGADVTEEFKRAVAAVPAADWRPLPRVVDGQRIGTDQEWAEVAYVPNWAGYSKRAPDYRFLAIREPLRQLELGDAAQLPFQTQLFGARGRYKLFGLVTNRTLPGDEVIRWQRERCGKSEEAHAVMKDDLAGGRLPSGLFGANAAWWGIMILAHNLNAVMKQLVLGGAWATRRLKALRFGLIALAGRVVRHARRLMVRVSDTHLTLLRDARAAIRALVPAPSG
jgi:hypothetical protein